MRRSLLRWWLGTSLPGLLLACGCRHAQQSCPTCGASASHVAVAPAASKAPNHAPHMADQSFVEEGPVMPVRNEAPIVHTAAKPMSPPSPAITAVEVGGQPASSPYHEGAATRRTFTDITAHPKFAHDPNYHWLVGTVDYSRIQRAWLLRYASVEEDDRYGGSVTLENPGQPNALKNGQLVRVEGHVINPDSSQLRPAFHVKNLRIEGP
ncbi:MAG TPA: hypothetical protein VN688_20630 [Gemmataceae bacterium]|nr:hypothetical protein [Gemmataceae bacterium]